MVAYGSLKTIENFKLNSTLKVVALALERCWLTKAFSNRDFTGNILMYFEKNGLLRKVATKERFECN